MNYPNRQTVDAVYTKEKGNPFLEALPELLGKSEFNRQVQSHFPKVRDLEKRSPQERRSDLSGISSWFQPMDYMYALYDMLYRSMAGTYQTKTVTDSVRQINQIYRDFRTGRESSVAYSTQAYSGAVLGVPGIGKTSAIKRCLDTMPQVIVHTGYQGKACYTKQINYLLAECPSDCSIKTLAFNIFSAIDRAIGSEYFQQMANLRSVAASAVTTKLKIICMNHHIGLIVIDEIQNAILTATRNKQVKPLIKFLVELTNETGVGICFCGTLEAEEVFCKQEHLKRRTRGLRLLPLKYDVTYRKFIMELWENQFVLGKTKLSEKLMKQIYDLSGGIPAYIVKIFQEAQAQAILSGKEKLSYDVMKQAVALLGIEVPKTYSRNGTSISDFTVQEVEFVEIEPVDMEPEGLYSEETGLEYEPPTDHMEDKEKAEESYKQEELQKAEEAVVPEESYQSEERFVPEEVMIPERAFTSEERSAEPVKRFYATRRGRPEKEREESDLLYIWRKGSSARQLIDVLESYHMAERRKF